MSANTPASIAGEDSSYPISLLIFELSHTEASHRLEAAKHIRTIANALGPERTRSEFLPYLQESLHDIDEVLVILAEQLGSLLPYVGSPQYVDLLLQPLEQIALSEEPFVRKAAVAAIGSIAKQLPADVVHTVVDSVDRMRSSEWPASRAAAASLCPAPFAGLPPSSRAKIADFYLNLADDVEVSVRRAAAAALPAFADAVRIAGDKSALTGALLKAFDSLCEDEHDSVRLLTPPATAAIVKASTAIMDSGGSSASRQQSADVDKIVARCVVRLLQDASWRVRYTAGDALIPLLPLLPASGELTTKVVDAAVTLFNDREAEVVAAAASAVGALSRVMNVARLEREVLPLLLQRLDEWVAEPPITAVAGVGSGGGVSGDMLVRAALAAAALELGATCSPAVVLRLLERVLEGADVSVKLAFLAHAQQLADSDGGSSAELLAPTLPFILPTASDDAWRVRQAATPLLGSLVRLANNIGTQRVAPALLERLSDPVHAVRKAAVHTLPGVVATLGSQWAQTSLRPALSGMLQNTSYMHRISGLYAVAKLANGTSAEVFTKEWLPLITPLLRDSLPNPRFVACKVLLPFAQRGRAFGSAIQPLVSPLVKDSDRDVSFFAKKVCSVVRGVGAKWGVDD